MTAPLTPAMIFAMTGTSGLAMNFLPRFTEVAASPAGDDEMRRLVRFSEGAAAGLGIGTAVVLAALTGEWRAIGWSVVIVATVLTLYEYALRTHHGSGHKGGNS